MSRAAPLQCTVRNCYRALTPHGRSWACDNGHTFDVARSGYLNLLQPQDRKSTSAGDSSAAIDARAALLSDGIGTNALDAMVDVALSLPLDTEVVADLGCGSGELLARLTERPEICAIGIDLSTEAITRAARRTPDVTWVVANIDRGIPLEDRSASLVTSLHARRNPDECHRVLVEGGHLLVAVPAKDDLIELREEALGDAVERDRAEGVIAEHERGFHLAAHTTVRERRSLDREALLRLLRGTYRGARTSASARVAALSALDVTLASDLLLFRRD